jgi:hypothetical protein
VTIEPTETPRDLTQGWCDEGQSLSDAAARRDPEEFIRIADHFKHAKVYEHRAASLLYAFTGHPPRSEDHQTAAGNSRTGAVDIALTTCWGSTEICEVSTTLDRRFQSSIAALQQLQDDILARYEGTTSWSLELERGWDDTRLRKTAPEIAERLNEADLNHNPVVSGEPTVVWVHEKISARMTASTVPPNISVHSYNAGQVNETAPYLDELSEYIATDATIQSKLNKLTKERPRLDAERSHLFLGMASTGPRGSHLPVSPSYFTWGRFTAPDGLDDLWLEGNTGELYHWTRERGWIFHQM